MKKLIVLLTLLVLVLQPMYTAQAQVEISTLGNFTLLMNEGMPPAESTYGFESSVSLSTIPMSIGVIGSFASSSTEVGNIGSQIYGIISSLNLEKRQKRFSLSFLFGPSLYLTNYNFSAETSSANMNKTLIGIRGGIGIDYHVNEEVSWRIKGIYRKAPVNSSAGDMNISGISVSTGLVFSF